MGLSAMLSPWIILFLRARKKIPRGFLHERNVQSNPVMGPASQEASPDNI